VKLRRNYGYTIDPGLVLAEEELERKPLSVADTQALLGLLAEEFGVPVPHLDIRQGMRKGVYCGRKQLIGFGPERLTEGAVIHEFAHHLHHVFDPIGAADDVHGPGFCKYFRAALEAWGTEVPHFEPYKLPRFTREFARKAIADMTGWSNITITHVWRPSWRARAVAFEDGPSWFIADFRLKHEEGNPYYHWVLDQGGVCWPAQRENDEHKEGNNDISAGGAGAV